MYFILYHITSIYMGFAHRSGSDGSMSASGSAGPGVSFENFQPRG